MKEIEIDGMDVEILLLEKNHTSGADDNINGSRNYRGTAQDPLCLVRVRQTSTGIDIQVLLRHKLHLFGAVATPTIMYGARTWTTTKEHENMIRTTQRRMLRLIIQNKRKYKNKKQKRLIKKKKRHSR